SHRFTPEVSMQIQHALGADIIFAFDECTTLVNTRAYQEASVARTEAWAERCLAEHVRLGSAQGPALFAVVQGAQHEDLRRMAARRLAALRVPSSTHDDGASFDGFGIGGALEKENLESIVGWVSSELPENKPRHLLGISGIDDLFAGVAAGADTFDCVAPTRTARHGAAFTPRGPVNVKRAGFRSDFSPLDSDCDCYTCAHYSCAYLHHLVRAGEMTGATLLTIHNLRWIIRLVDTMREAIPAGTFPALRQETLAHYHPHPA
ncbi:MAG: tRNA-guanine transglycosylase, partial [Micrococcales bacterium]|nr:tRNA-guanine transglycosylase [Micrococcales bacterium]